MASDRCKVASVFIDESGAKNSSGGSFVVGFIKTYTPGLLYRSIRDIRQRHSFHEEIKFSAVTAKNIRFYFDIVEEIAGSPHIARVGGSVYDATHGFGTKQETWKEQASMARRLIVGNLNQDEKVKCFLDLVQTPRGESVADKVKREANKRLNGNPVLEAYDVDSKSHDLVQLADVVAGAIHYTRTHQQPRNKKESPKQRVAKRLQRALDLDSFDDVKQGKVNVLTMTGPDENLPASGCIERLVCAPPKL